MKFLPNSSEQNVGVESQIFVTPSEVIEYLFCPRFIYYMNCLHIPQHEEKRYKVLKGRELHEEKARINTEYLRKKLGVVDKEMLVWMASERYHIKGEVDEVLWLSDGTMAPLDYKFAEYQEFTFKTHRYQAVLYALLIQENYGKEVNRGYVCYIRSNNLVKEIQFTEKDFDCALDAVRGTLLITQTGFYPKKAAAKMRCIDCCYRNICV